MQSEILIKTLLAFVIALATAIAVTPVIKKLAPVIGARGHSERRTKNARQTDASLRGTRDFFRIFRIVFYLRGFIRRILGNMARSAFHNNYRNT